MFILGRGKARNRKTGEIVYVVSHNGESDKRRKTDWVSYITANLEEHEMVKGLNAYWDFEELSGYEEREKERAYETHLCLFSGMAMQSLIRTKRIDELNTDGCIDFLTELSVEYGKALCAHLDKVDLKEVINQKPEPEENYEVAIGKTVEFQGESYLSTEVADNEDCTGCAFKDVEDCKFCGYCYKDNRSDGKCVIFVKGGKV